MDVSSSSSGKGAKSRNGYFSDLAMQYGLPGRTQKGLTINNIVVDLGNHQIHNFIPKSFLTAMVKFGSEHHSSAWNRLTVLPKIDQMWQEFIDRYYLPEVKITLSGEVQQGRLTRDALYEIVKKIDKTDVKKNIRIQFYKLFNYETGKEQNRLAVCRTMSAFIVKLFDAKNGRAKKPTNIQRKTHLGERIMARYRAKMADHTTTDIWRYKLALAEEDRNSYPGAISELADPEGYDGDTDEGKEEDLDFIETPKVGKQMPGTVVAKSPVLETTTEARLKTAIQQLSKAKTEYEVAKKNLQTKEDELTEKDDAVRLYEKDLLNETQDKNFMQNVRKLIPTTQEFDKTGNEMLSRLRLMDMLEKTFHVDPIKLVVDNFKLKSDGRGEYVCLSQVSASQESSTVEPQPVASSTPKKRDGSEKTEQMKPRKPGGKVKLLHPQSAKPIQTCDKAKLVEMTKLAQTRLQERWSNLSVTYRARKEEEDKARKTMVQQTIKNRRIQADLDARKETLKKAEREKMKHSAAEKRRQDALAGPATKCARFGIIEGIEPYSPTHPGFDKVNLDPRTTSLDMTAVVVDNTRSEPECYDVGHVCHGVADVEMVKQMKALNPFFDLMDFNFGVPDQNRDNGSENLKTIPQAGIAESTFIPTDACEIPVADSAGTSRNINQNNGTSPCQTTD